MANILLPILPGNLPTGYCFTSWQQTLNDFANNMQAVLAGCSFFNYGPTRPDPEYQAYPWLRTTDMRWFRFDGVWISPNPRAPGEHHWEIFSSESEIWSWDGGDGTNPATNPPTDRSGAMWQLEVLMNGRCPFSPNGGTITYEGTGGAESVTLSEAEGATGAHTHPIGKASRGNDDAYFPLTGVMTTPSWAGFSINGNVGHETPQSFTTADLYTLEANNGAGVTTTAHNNMPPWFGMACIVRTARTMYQA